ncbi:hypothetical protein DFH08DRAFT_1079041 [Mycena albidolilacea]|uniref:Uncharacterized protein n=1 Tax=Mycena albidolilacea TaxID=1033008 RepID=A0AAD7EUR5_9AGAR|nr:hypothetical protein DFH08DRAFT_1079041 [Mycena albidolilacea]
MESPSISFSLPFPPIQPPWNKTLLCRAGALSSVSQSSSSILSPQTFFDTLPILRRSPMRSNGSATGSCKDTRPPRFSSLYARPARSSTTPINGSPAAAPSPPQPQPPHPQSWKRALQRTRTVSLSSRQRSRAPCRPYRPYLLPQYPHPLQLRPPPAVKSSCSSARLRSLPGGCPPTGWCRCRSRCLRTSAPWRCTSCAGGRSCFCSCWLRWAWRGGSGKYEKRRMRRRQRCCSRTKTRT